MVLGGERIEWRALGGFSVRASVIEDEPGRWQAKTESLGFHVVITGPTRETAMRRLGRLVDAALAKLVTERALVS